MLYECVVELFIVIRVRSTWRTAITLNHALLRRGRTLWTGARAFLIGNSMVHLIQSSAIFILITKRDNIGLLEGNLLNFLRHWYLNSLRQKILKTFADFLSGSFSQYLILYFMWHLENAYI